MESIPNQTDRFFRERLADLSPVPDDRVWIKIANQMARTRRKRTLVFFFRIAAGMALLVSLGVGGFYISRNNRTAKMAVDDRTVTGKGKAETKVFEGREITAENQTGKTESNKAEPGILAVTMEGASETRTTDTPAPTDTRQETKVQQVVATEPAISPALLTPRPAHLALQVVPMPFSTRPIASPEPWTGNLADLVEPEVTEDALRHAWRIGSEVAPLYSYRTIASDYLNQSAMQAMNQSEDGLFAYAGGISVGYATGKRLRIESGVYYSRYGQEKNKVEAFTARYENLNTGMASSSYISIPNSTGQIVAQASEEADYDKVVSNSTGSMADLDNFSGFPGISTSYYTSEELTGLSATQYFDYLEVPLMVSYRVIDRKLGFSINGGLVTNFLVNNGLTLHNNGSDEDLGRTSGINNVNYLGSVGLGFDYPIMNKVAFSLTPRFRYYLNPIDRSSQINVHPYSFGIFAGFSYTFN